MARCPQGYPQVAVFLWITRHIRVPHVCAPVGRVCRVIDYSEFWAMLALPPRPLGSGRPRKVPIMASKTEVAVASVVPDAAGIDSMEAAIKALASAGIESERISEYGDGFVLIGKGDKVTLVKVPFVIWDATFRTDADTGREYLSMRIITADGRKLVVNDGSQGLYKQAIEIDAKRGTLAGLVVVDGLTGGEYTTVIDGETVKASTFYFAGV